MGSRTAPASSFELARQFQRAGRASEAEALYRKLLEEEPAHHGALYALSTLAVEAGQNEAAAELLSRAIGIAPDNPSYHTNLGEVRRRLGQYEEAARCLVRALALKPDLPEAVYNLAVVLEENGELDAAIEQYEKAADLKPGGTAFQRGLARALSKRGDLHRAAGHFACASILNPGSLEILGALATTLGRGGRSDGAAATAHRALAIHPDFVVGHQVIGAWHMERSRHQDAIASFRRALTLDPLFAAARTGLDEALAAGQESPEQPDRSPESPMAPGETPGTTHAASKKAQATRTRAIDRAHEHERAGRLSAAAALYRQALEVDPNDATVMRSLARLALQANESAEAVRWLVSAVSLVPGWAGAFVDLGNAFRGLDRHREAADAFMKALALEPELAEAAHGLGLALARTGDPATSLAYLERAADLQPGVFAFQREFARALRDDAAFERSIAHYHCALAVAPDRADALVELGTVLRRLGRLDAAVATHRRAATLEPGSAPALAHLGAALADQWHIDEAIESGRRALALDPNSSLAHFQLGNAFVGAGEIDLAIESWRRTIALDVQNRVAHSNLAWMVSYSSRFDGEAILEEARAWARQHADPLADQIRPHTNDRQPLRRLKIGYVSSDFYEHSAAYFLTPLFRHSDHEDFEVHCYSSTRKPDAITERLRRQADVWRDIDRLGDLSAAELIREDRIDVLVDLGMHTGSGRPRLFACKPAPVQICWLGYAGTTGLDAMDYRVTDPFLDPPELGKGPYSESPLVLPETFWCYDPLGSEPDPGPLPAIRAGHVTFGCQNSFHKINGDVLALWARVLRTVAGSRLVVHAPQHAQARLLEGLERLGVAQSRVEVVARRRRLEYLKTYQRIDIGLDTIPFNGATTSLDALWMGVPVVTLVGSTVVGRAGRCLAMNLGLPELAANTPDEFERIAVALAGDLESLEKLRSKLRPRLEASPLMDGPRFARNLEAAYRTAWTSWCEQAGPPASSP